MKKNRIRQRILLIFLILFFCLLFLMILLLKTVENTQPVAELNNNTVVLQKLCDKLDVERGVE